MEGKGTAGEREVVCYSMEAGVRFYSLPTGVAIRAGPAGRDGSVDGVAGGASSV